MHSCCSGFSDRQPLCAKSFHVRVLHHIKCSTWQGNTIHPRFPGLSIQNVSPITFEVQLNVNLHHCGV